MNKTLYNIAMDKVTMSDECLGNILDSIEDVQTEKKSRKIRYIHIIAALAVFVFGSVGVAAETVGFDWIKGFFNNNDSENEVVINQAVTDLITELEDFKCESDYGIKFSPVGCISDYRNLYVSLNIDELPDDIDLKNDGYFFDLDFSDKQGRFNTGTNWSVIENNAVSLCMECSEDFFKNGETVELYLKKYDAVTQLDTTYAKMNFKISNDETYHTLKVDYSNYKPDENYDNTFDEITVTPLSISTQGKKDVWLMDINGNFYDRGLFRFVFNDGTESITHLSSGCGNISGYNYASVFMEGPINPDNIVEIYFGDMLIYRK